MMDRRASLRLAFQDAEWRQYSRLQLFQMDHLPRDASSRARSAARRADFRVLSTVSLPTFSARARASHLSRKSSSSSSVRCSIPTSEFRAAPTQNQLIKFDLNGRTVTVLRVLNQKNHKESDDGGAGVNDELPGVGEAEQRAADSPNDNDTCRDDKSRSPARRQGSLVGEIARKTLILATILLRPFYHPYSAPLSARG